MTYDPPDESTYIEEIVEGCVWNKLKLKLQ